MGETGDGKYNLFKNIKYKISGVVSDEIIDLLKNNGAEGFSYFSDYVTHCIVGDDPSEYDVIDANDLYEIPTVTCKWVTLSAKCGKLLPVKGFSYGDDKLFCGVNCCLSQMSSADAKAIWAMVTYNGGKCSLKFTSNTTHLIVGKSTGAKYEKAVCNNNGSSVKVHCVTPDWVPESIKGQIRCSEVLYHPRLLTEKEQAPRKFISLSTAHITGFADGKESPKENVDAPTVSSQLLDQLKQRMPWNRPPTTPVTPVTRQTPQQQFQIQQRQLLQQQQLLNFNPVKTQQFTARDGQMQEQYVSSRGVTASQQPKQQPQDQPVLPHALAQLHQQIRQKLQQQQPQDQPVLPHVQAQLHQQIRQKPQQLQDQPVLPHARAQLHQQIRQKLQQPQDQPVSPHVQAQLHQQIRQKPQQLQDQPVLPNARAQLHQQIRQKLQQQQPQGQPALPHVQAQLHQQIRQKPQQPQGQPVLPHVRAQLHQQIRQKLQQPQDQPVLPHARAQLHQQIMQKLQQQQPQNQPVLPHARAQLHQQIRQKPQQQQLSNRQIQQRTMQTQVSVAETGGVPLKQVIHMDALTHSQLQRINPKQRTAFLEEIKKQGQLLLERQLHAQQQQRQEELLRPQNQTPQVILNDPFVTDTSTVVGAQSLQGTPTIRGHLPPESSSQQQLQSVQYQHNQIIRQNPQSQHQVRFLPPEPSFQQQLQSVQYQRNQIIHLNSQLQHQVRFLPPQPSSQQQLQSFQHQRNQIIHQNPQLRHQILLQQQQRLPPPQQQPPPQTIQKDAARTYFGVNPAVILSSQQQNSVVASNSGTCQQAVAIQQSSDPKVSQQESQIAANRLANLKIVQQHLHGQSQQQQVQPTTTPHQYKIKGAVGSNCIISLPPPRVSSMQAPGTNRHPIPASDIGTGTGTEELDSLFSEILQEVFLPEESFSGQLNQAQHQPPVTSSQCTTLSSAENVPAHHHNQSQSSNNVAGKGVKNSKTPISQDVFLFEESVSEQHEAQKHQPPVSAPLLSNPVTVMPPLNTAASQWTTLSNVEKASTPCNIHLGVTDVSSSKTPILQDVYSFEGIESGPVQHQSQHQTPALASLPPNPTAVATPLNTAAPQRTTLSSVGNVPIPHNIHTVGEVEGAKRPNNQTAARVAEVLAKSAAATRVPGIPQYRDHYYGHNRNVNLPPGKCLLGCIFFIVEYDRSGYDINSWRRVITENGGDSEDSYSLRVTHILCQTQKHPFVQQGLRDGKRCITADWLSDTILKKKLLPPRLALHFPTPFSDEKPCRKLIISYSGFEGIEKIRVKKMICNVGAKMTSYFSSHNHILVCRTPVGEKYKKAQEWGTPVVNVQWLNLIWFGHYSCLNQPNSVRYQQFNIWDPFSIDYALVPHLMSAWKTPIDVTQESYDRVKSCLPKPPRQKRLRLSSLASPDPDQENREMFDVSVTNPNPPAVDKRPIVVFSGVENDLEEQKKVWQLGGIVAQNCWEATHLVVTTLQRTFKLLCCISTVEYILPLNWLMDSYEKNTFLNEEEYSIANSELENTFEFSLSTVLKTPKRDELFTGKTFYITPGVIPSPSALYQIIECAGGDIEKKRRSLKQIKESEPNTYLIITIKNDLHLVSDVLRDNIDVYSSEFVMCAVLKQKIDYDLTLNPMN